MSDVEFPSRPFLTDKETPQTMASPKNNMQLGIWAPWAVDRETAATYS